ncbi:MAG: AAA family ATPase [Acidobacteria bacterium]|nr:AAA family ATPase [Acidobacteriota bacterium]
MLTLFPRVQTALRVEEHYGLAQRPFALTLDQHFVFHSRSYAAALQDVRRALDQREGLVVVTGDAGTGKTMLCRTLVQQLDPATCVSVVLDPRVTVEDLLLHILTEAGAPCSSATRRSISIPPSSNSCGSC